MYTQSGRKKERDRLKWIEREKNISGRKKNEKEIEIEKEERKREIERRERERWRDVERKRGINREKEGNEKI